MIVKRFGCTTIHNKALYKYAIIHSFNVYGRFVLYFHLHYQVIPKIVCMFSKPYEVRKLF